MRAADLAGASREHPVSLRVREHLPAGVVAREPVAAGVAARIMTGAPVPPGADAVVMIEVTDGGSARGRGVHGLPLWATTCGRAGRACGPGTWSSPAAA